MTKQITSKQPQPHRERDWYPYYAGYPEAFVSNVLDAHFDGAQSILDPWNGSGTTTAVSALRGISAQGVEINPAATVIARARLTPVSVQESLAPLAREIAVAARRVSPSRRSDDPLANWLRSPAVDAFRHLQHAIHVVLSTEPSLQLALSNEPQEASNNLGLLPSFYYTALFAAARQVLASFGASNPTWLRNPKTYRHRINPDFDLIADAFIDRTTELAGRLRLPNDAAASAVRVTTGSVLDLNEIDAFDGCLTSPPYATRVDYVRGSIAELAVMGLGDLQIQELRRQTTGTPVVRGVASGHESLSSACARRVARRVREHESHGSRNYYGPWIENYLRDLQRSLTQIDSAVRNDSRIALVVQDSYYKDVHIDLQRITIETMHSLGRRKQTQVDFPVRRSLARMNPSTRARPENPPLRESLLLFGCAP